MRYAILGRALSARSRSRTGTGGSYTLAGTRFTCGSTTVTADNGHVWTAADFLFV